jgi:hypothetical protein
VLKRPPVAAEYAVLRVANLTAYAHPSPRLLLHPPQSLLQAPQMETARDEF